MANFMRFMAIKLYFIFFPQLCRYYQVDVCTAPLRFFKQVEKVVSGCGASCLGVEWEWIVVSIIGYFPILPATSRELGTERPAERVAVCRPPCHALQKASNPTISYKIPQYRHFYPL